MEQLEKNWFLKDFMTQKVALNADENFKLKNGQTVNGEFPLTWKWSLTYGMTNDEKETTVKEFKSEVNEKKNDYHQMKLKIRFQFMSNDYETFKKNVMIIL